jgi:hypothetical protein
MQNKGGAMLTTYWWLELLAALISGPLCYLALRRLLFWYSAKRRRDRAMRSKWDEARYHLRGYDARPIRPNVRRIV